MSDVISRWMGEHFPFYCRRVCRQCTPTDGAELMLQQCPIVRLDAYAGLQKTHTNGHISKNIAKTVEEIVTPELIHAVQHTPKPQKAIKKIGLHDD